MRAIQGSLVGVDDEDWSSKEDNLEVAIALLPVFLSWERKRSGEVEEELGRREV